jgi:hypothetical protein
MGEPSTSVFNSLFTRVEHQDAARDPLEDFTTEALAGAIRRDARPMLAALAQGSFNPANVSEHHLTVLTQRTYLVPGDEIRLDLVLLWSAKGSAIELWIEVKTGSPLSGKNQLRRYADAQTQLTSMDGVARPRLVLLSTSDLRSGDTAGDLTISAHTSWQDVVDAVRETHDPDSLWLEFVLFLKEKRMTQDATFPITAREATSLGDAHRLYLKSIDLLNAVNAVGSERFPTVANGWWRSNDIPGFVRRQFRDHARFCLGLWGGSKIGLTFGLVSGHAGEAMYTVWLEADPRYGDVRARVHAEAGALAAAGWELQYEGWILVQTRAHTVNFPTLEQATAWFVDRFTDLDNAGLFALQHELVPGSGAPIAATEDEPTEPR